MTRLYILWAFIQWCFMNLFGGCFNFAEKFRYELKKGPPDSIFAIVGFVILSVIVGLATILLSAWLVDEKPTVGIIATCYFWTVVFTFFYNVIKAAFECFEEERQDLIERLKS